MKDFTLRASIYHCVTSSTTFLTAREVSQRTGFPYKATIDALNALHNRGRIARTGRKFSAKWGSAALVPTSTPFNGWHALANHWFGRFAAG